MSTLSTFRLSRSGWLLAALGLLAGGPAWSQVPVDAEGNPLDAEVVGETPSDAAAPAGEATVPAQKLSAEALDELVGPIALYPDDLLAVVLPASAYPLQIVEAARFLEALEDDPDLKPDEAWDDSVVALLNYPEVVEMMNEDLDWTYALGEAVVAQQADVIDAIERFRDRAYAAGNLKSDERQTVTRDNGVIEIEPASEEVIYVPYYEPERVVVYQSVPVYHYYSRPCPVYYYPYPYGYSFASGYFWGVTTAFQMGWLNHHLLVFHHSYWGHPYFGHSYFYDRWWYRRPSIRVHNTFYVNNNRQHPSHHERDGDFWRPRRHSGAAIDRREFREAYYSDRRQHSETGYARGFDSSRARGAALREDVASRLAANRDRDSSSRFTRDRAGSNLRERETGDVSRREGDAAVRFRSRAGADAARSGDDAIRFRSRDRGEVTRQDGDNGIRFRTRERSNVGARESSRREPERSDAERRSTSRSVPTPSLRERPALRRDPEPARRAPPGGVRRSDSSRPSAGLSRAAPRVSPPSSGVSRPAPHVSRPSSGVSRPAPHVSRPSPDVSRPAPHVSRPSSGVSRPAPHVSRPSSSSRSSSSHRSSERSIRRQNRD